MTPTVLQSRALEESVHRLAKSAQILVRTGGLLPAGKERCSGSRNDQHWNWQSASTWQPSDELHWLSLLVRAQAESAPADVNCKVRFFCSLEATQHAAASRGPTELASVSEFFNVFDSSQNLRAWSKTQLTDADGMVVHDAECQALRWLEANLPSFIDTAANRSRAIPV